jgi:hypothetical protein
MKSWLDIITEEGSLWLDANGTEEAGDLSEAAFLFLQDAMDSLRRSKPVGAALSASCAANCLSRIGAVKEARQLYASSGELYTSNARRCLRLSIREALWSLRNAHSCYSLAGDAERSASTEALFLALWKRVSPLQGGGEPAGSNSLSDPVLSESAESQPLSSRLNGAVVAFASEFEGQGRRQSRRAETGLATDAGENTIEEERVISNLG